jgi:hypothetical protein
LKVDNPNFVGVRSDRSRQSGSAARRRANAGFKCQFKGYPGKQAVWVIMTNGDRGADLYNEITAALIRAYGWE